MRISLLLSLFLFSNACVFAEDSLLKDIMKGEHYAATGVFTIRLAMNGKQSSLTEKNAKFDSIRLNQVGEKWHLDFYDIPMASIPGNKNQNQAHFSVELPEKPEVGVLKLSHSLSLTSSGISAELETTNPKRQDTEKPSVSFKEGYIGFEEVDIRRDGTLIGYLSFESESIEIYGPFELILKDPPPLIPIRN